MKNILIANRGEVAVRVARAAQDLGIGCTTVHSRDDAASMHARAGDASVALEADGPAAYLDVQALLRAARRAGCDAVHPGYGYLSERADFAQACRDAGLCFIGPSCEQLGVLGDKAAARALAARCQVPLLPGSPAAVTLEQAHAFMRSHDGAPIMVKAVHGGGGRGMRLVHDEADLAQAYGRCVAEAQSAFGAGAVYVERVMARARHIEVQVVGDGRQVIALGERDCSLQRRFQKLVEVAPSPTLGADLRARLVDAALGMARRVRFESLGTFEFLVDVDEGASPAFAFMEANPRLQVEHTVTEEVYGLDLVQMQIRLAAGETLEQLGLDPAHPPVARGYALQWRVNAETLDSEGQAWPAVGTITQLQWPCGPGVRVDTHAAEGYAPSPLHDTLLAKLIVSTRDANWPELVRRAHRALQTCRIQGLQTNLAFLQALAARAEFAHERLDTQFVQRHLQALWVSAQGFADGAQTPGTAAPPGVSLEPPWDEALEAVRAPMPARVVEIGVQPGQLVHAGQQLMVLEAMKMHHLVPAPGPGRVSEVRAALGGFVDAGAVLLVLSTHSGAADEGAAAPALDLDAVRPDLQRVIDRHAHGLDIHRGVAVAKRHAAGGRTARENIADLCDPDSFMEYGALAIAAQTRRRSLDDLIRLTPADGMITGLGTVNVAEFGAPAARCAVLAYDYTVLAGTQGLRNHQKTDRMLGLAHRHKHPVVLFAEGGGGRPGDTDMPIVAGLNNHTFSQFAALSGQVPVVGVVAGRCFAGNAALLGCADVIIATMNSNIGMGGPAMVEGGGIGTFRAEQIGPSEVHRRNGVIDVLVTDEAHAVRTARRYLSYFQGTLSNAQCGDQRVLRHIVPEHRLRVYDMRAAIRALFDLDSVLELRSGFGLGLITSLARVQGRPVGVMANNPSHLGGAIDVEAADKAARFMQLCDAHGLPIVSLTDTPGFMVGPDIEAHAQVRHACRMFVVAAQLSVPFFAVVLRKGYGLGAQAMTAGGFDAPVFTVSWPSGEFGAMGLEGAVRLGFRRELEAQAQGPARDALYRQLVAQQYENGSAMNMAATLEIDAVIDPAETRSWLVRGLVSAPPPPPSARPSRRMIDPW